MLSSFALHLSLNSQSNQGGAPRPEEKPHEKAVLDQLAEALRQQGFPNLAEDRRLLARFARTRNFDPVPTLPLLLEYGRWRASLSLDTLTWDDVRGEMAKKHTMRLPVLTGDVENGPTARDAEGHPVIYKIQCNWRVSRYALRAAAVFPAREKSARPRLRRALACVHGGLQCACAVAVEND